MNVIEERDKKVKSFCSEGENGIEIKSKGHNIEVYSLGMAETNDVG